MGKRGNGWWQSHQKDENEMGGEVGRGMSMGEGEDGV
jgi:hypothetical protein